ncbi:MAG: preprotein translocase subunit SecG [Bacteroidetes bacterium HGW-Bacteroidetes-6]|jgi:preprotein translocase subunit SecG|nr:MAG: preprotein translocase subunit SecG [Bacteroidetes bacterium HGW-Bacteroidetes-6]
MGFYVFLVVIMIIVCVLLGLIVLVQNSKGGGLVTGMQSSNQFMGVRQTADFLEKSTWTLAIVILGLSLISIFAIPSGQTNTEDSRVKKYIEESGYEPIQTPATPIQGENNGQ